MRPAIPLVLALLALGLLGCPDFHTDVPCGFQGEPCPGTDGGTPDGGIPDAGSPDGGIRFTGVFIGGGGNVDAGAISFQGSFQWQGSSPDSGITFSGGFR
jgi:hypothetical protein